MYGVLVWFGVVGVKPRWQGFRIRLWVFVGQWQDMAGMEEVYGGALWLSRQFCVLQGWYHMSSAWCVIFIGSGCALVSF